jgi:drug/metabolite transporter (DMT)-like permease
VLAAAALHAAWNALVAGASDTHATTAVALTVGAAAFALPALLTWDVDGAAWPYIVASAALELTYFALLAAVYGRADYTFAYPVARGVAPVLVLAVSVAFLGVSVGLLAALGVLAVTGGVLLVRGVGAAAADVASLALALGVGACIAGYTLVDKEGLKHADALTYLELVLVVPAIAYAAWIGRGRLRAAFGWRAAVAGVGMFGAYGLVLLALRLTAAAPVAAVRETSIVIATMLGAVVLHESVGRARLFGSAVIVAGVAAIALA